MRYRFAGSPRPPAGGGGEKVELPPQAGLPLRQAKLRPPYLRHSRIPRPRLVTQISTGLQRGLVLLSAPPGFGKTTLLAEWAATWPHALAWLTLDAEDNDPSRFLCYLHAALRQAGLDHLTSAANVWAYPSPEAAFEKAFTSLTNALEALSTPLAVVLDDYHLMTNPALHSALATWIEALPPHLHLLIATRQDPPFPLARWRGRGLLTELRASDLRLDRRETHAFLTQVMGLRLSEAEAEPWFQRSEGWIAGLQLLALGRNTTATAETSPLPGGEAYVVDYLLEEVLAGQPAEIQAFLLHTAILETLSAPLCAAVSPQPLSETEAQALLHHLEHANLFLDALDAEGRCFRYHPLFAEALRRRLEELYPAPARADLHRRAAAWLAEHGDPQGALQHALASGDPDLVTAHLTRHGETLLKSGQLPFLLQTLRRLPEDHLAAEPRLALLYATCLALSLDLESAAAWAGRAERHLRDHPAPTPAALGAVWAVQSMIAALRGEGDQALDLTRRALEVLPAEDAFSRSYVAFNQALHHALAAAFPQAEAAFKTAIALAQASGNWMLLMMAHCHLGEVQAARGRLSQALETFEHALALTADLTHDPLGFRGDLHVEIGEILLKRNDLSTAQAYLARGLELCQRWLPTSIALEGYLHLAHLRQSLGDLEGAQTALDQAHAMVHLTQSDLDDRIVHLYRLRLGLLRGEWAPAWEWAQREGWLSAEGLNPTAVAEPPLLDIYLRLTLARLLLVLAQAQGETTPLVQARSLLDALLPRLEQADFVEAQIEAHLLRALVLERQGEREGAVAAVWRALALAEPEGFRRPFLDEGLALLPLLGHMLGRVRRRTTPSTPPSAAFVQQLIAALAATRHAAPAGAFEVETAVLTPREREILRLVAQGLSNGEIALTLCLALNTVKRHLNNLYLKLGVRTRTQAVARARELGLLD